MFPCDSKTLILLIQMSKLFHAKSEKLNFYIFRFVLRRPSRSSKLATTDLPKTLSHRMPIFCKKSYGRYFKSAKDAQDFLPPHLYTYGKNRVFKKYFFPTFAYLNDHS